MNIRILFSMGVLAAVPLAATAAAGQAATDVPVTLREAVDAALDGNRALAAARARADAAEANARSVDGFLFPSVQATAGVNRTNDPVGVFGTKLRQRRFDQADFDIGALNDPDAVTDWTAGIGAQWDIAQFHRWGEREAGDARARAAAAAVGRTREGTVFRTRVLYVDAVRAQAALEAMEASLASATATRDRVRRRVEEGMGTQADVLQAEAAVAGMQARVEHTRAGVADARESLGTWLGWPGDRIPVPSQGAYVLGAAASAVSSGGDLMDRADLVAGRAGVEAAQADARAVNARRLPGLQAFGRLSTHASEVATGRESNWTVGVQLSLPLFTGFSLTRGAEAARAQARALALEQAQREDEAAAEVRAAGRGVEAARRALDAARAAHASADEAVRLLRRRYEEGMATVADLLQAEAQTAALKTGVVDAEANLSMALAALDFALGRDVPEGDAGTETR